MDKPRVGYTPRSGSTRESEVQALVAVYSFILKCHERKMTADTRHSEVATENRDAGKTPEEPTAKEEGG